MIKLNSFENIISLKENNLESLSIYLEEIKKIQPYVDTVSYFEEILKNIYLIIEDEDDVISNTIRKEIFERYNININSCNVCDKIQKELNYVEEELKDIDTKDKIYINENEEESSNKKISNNQDIEFIIRELENSFDNDFYKEVESVVEDNINYNDLDDDTYE